MSCHVMYSICCGRWVELNSSDTFDSQAVCDLTRLNLASSVSIYTHRHLRIRIHSSSSCTAVLYFVLCTTYLCLYLSDILCTSIPDSSRLTATTAVEGGAQSFFLVVLLNYVSLTVVGGIGYPWKCWLVYNGCCSSTRYEASYSHILRTKYHTLYIVSCLAISFVRVLAFYSRLGLFLPS